MKKFLTLTMAALIIFGGCKKDDENPDNGETQVAVTGVTLSPSAAQELAVGGTLALTATVAPSNATNKAVTWKSSNTAAAIVSGSGTSATVTARAEGETTITVTTADGGKTASVAVTVTAGGEPEFTASPSTPIAFTSASGTYEITVTANVAWTAESNADWLSLDPASGTGDATVTVTALAYSVPNAEARAATVTFSMTEFNPLEIAVTQTGITATLCAKCLWDGEAWVDGYVSEYYTNLNWSGHDNKYYGATSDKDGRANTNIVTDATPESLIGTCKGLGEGWYLPAYEELYNMVIDATKSTWWINPGNRTTGLNGEPFANLLSNVGDGRWYASSSEYYQGTGVITTSDNTTEDSKQENKTNDAKIINVDPNGGLNGVIKTWVGGSVCVWRQP